MMFRDVSRKFPAFILLML